MHDHERQELQALSQSITAANDDDVMVIRASSFGGLFDCSLRWQQIHLEKIRTMSSPRALIGSGVHAGAAAFDQAKVDGAIMRLDDAVGFAIDEIAQRIEDEPVNWTGDEPSRRDVENIATRMTMGYCTELSPLYTFESVELKAKPLDIRCGNGQIVRLTGTLDRSRAIIEERDWLPIEDPRRIVRKIGDLKTGIAVVNADGVVKTGKHRAQLGTYEIIYEHTTGHEVSGDSEIIGMNTGGKFLTGHGIVKGAKALLVGGDDYPGLLDMAAQMFRTGLFPPNPQSSLCSEKYCPHWQKCPYADK